MQNWEKAREHFEKLEAFPDSKKLARQELQRVSRRLEEHKFGRYDMNWLYNYAIVQGEKWLDVADYYGPVEVSDLTAAGKGKGLIAQRRIEKGTLLIAEKAFAMTYDKRSLWPNSFS